MKLINCLTSKKFLIVSSLIVIVIIITLLVIFFTKSNNSHEPIIYTTSGKIRGIHHGHYYSFESIPYAEPPVGENRFESPKPYEPKSDIDGTRRAPYCMQWMHLKDTEGSLAGLEDCLFVNVYTPSISGNDIYPILVFIHGGEFMVGNGGFKHHPQAVLRNRNMIVASMNYRLGPLGFLSTEDEEISGNMGLKDQRLALQWIKENALAFNGDPNSILLTGLSAGGASVHFHLLSSATEKLASAAISFSGTANCPWVLVPKPLDRAKRLAELLNCTNDSTNSIKICLKEKSAEEIVKSVRHFKSFLNFPFRTFGPVIESSSVKGAFLTQHPIELIQNGNFSKIPYLISNTMDEGGYYASNLIMKRNDSSLYLEEFLQRFYELAPQALYYGETMTAGAAFLKTQHLRERYRLFNNDPLLDKYMRLQEMFSVELLLNDAKVAVKLHRNYGTKAVFKYMYDNPAPHGLGNINSNRTDINFGTVHSDDVNLLFYPQKRNYHELRPDEEEVSTNLIKMMRNFAITGKLVYGNIDVPQNIPKLTKVIYLKITGEKASIELEDD